MNRNLVMHLGDPLPVSKLDGSTDLRPAVEEKARALHDITRRAFPGWSPPPFDPVTIAQALGIPVRYAGMPPHCDAMLVPDLRAGFQIVCDGNTRSEGRVRFSVAHELVHTFFDDAPLVVNMRSRARGSESRPEDVALERTCDAGAAELIMPRRSFAAVLKKLGIRAGALPEIAARFGVSLQAAAVRLLECAGESVAAVGFFHYALRPSSTGEAPDGSVELPTYRVQRVFAGSGIPFLFPAGKSVPRSSVIYTCSLGNKELAAEEVFRLKSHHASLRVTACPLPSRGCIPRPPTVCAIFSNP